MAELAPPIAPDRWSVVVAFDDSAVVRSHERRGWLRDRHEEHCEGMLQNDCAARFVIYEPEVRVSHRGEFGGESSDPRVRAIVGTLEPRLPMLSHCVWFTHDETGLEGRIGLSLSFDDDGELARATVDPDGLSVARDSALARCLVAALDGVRSDGALVTSLVFDFGPPRGAAGTAFGATR